MSSSGFKSFPSILVSRPLEHGYTTSEQKILYKPSWTQQAHENNWICTCEWINIVQSILRLYITIFVFLPDIHV